LVESERWSMFPFGNKKISFRSFGVINFESIRSSGFSINFKKLERILFFI